MAIKPAINERVRKPIPTGKEAEEELRRIRRQERRRARAERKRKEAAGEPLEDDDTLPPPSPVAFEGIPTPEQMRESFWSAFYDLGGTAGLVAWGRRYPKEFYAIWARICVPKDNGAPPSNSLEDMLSQLGED